MNDRATDSRLLGALLRLPSEAILAAVHQRLVDAGYTDLTPSHLIVFQHLPAAGARQTELARAAQMTKQSMGYLVDHLEEWGYMERVPDPADRRARLVRLTDKGREIERLAREAIARTEADWAKRIGEGRMREFTETLRELADLVADEQRREWLSQRARSAHDQAD